VATSEIGLGESEPSKRRKLIGGIERVGIEFEKT
jgi:hypothetical protein